MVGLIVGLTVGLDRGTWDSWWDLVGLMVGLGCGPNVLDAECFFFSDFRRFISADRRQFLWKVARNDDGWKE